MARIVVSRSVSMTSLRGGLRQRWVCVLLAAAATAASGGLTIGKAMAQDATVLEPGTPVVREISGDRRDSYQLRLKGGQLATIRVDQRTIDVVVELVGSDGATIIEADDEYGNGSQERLAVLAEATAVYTVSVRSRLARAPAGEYQIRLAEIRPAAPRDHALHEARRLRAQAARLLRAGEAAKAVPIAERALAVAERVLEPDDVFVALLATSLGVAYEEAAEYSHAQRQYARALEVLTAKLGPDHPQTAFVQSRLGARYTSLGDYATAERLILEALRRQEAALGPEHPILALTLRSLGVLCDERGDFDGAVRAFERAAAIVAKWHGTDNELFWTLENNLGAVYTNLRDYQRAEPYLVRSLAAREKMLGPEHPRLAVPVQNLGIIAREKKDYAAAERYYLRALAIREKSVGLDHPAVAGTLNNLANVYGAQGDYARSLAMHLRALSITEKHASRWVQPILSLGNIARTYAALGDYQKALEFQSRVDAALEVHTALNLAIGSERQKIAYLNGIAERTERTVSFNLQLQPDNAEATRLAAGALLQRKGRALDAMTNTLAAIRLHAGADDRLLLDRLSETTTRFAQLALAGPQKTPAEEHRRTLHELEDTRERLEAEISQRSDEFRAASRRVTFDAVQAAIPAGAALIEFAVYRPFNPKAQSMTVAYGQPRYAVYVVRGEKAIGRDLGDAAAIDAAVEDYRAALQDPNRADLRRVARALDEKIMRPVRGLARDAARLLISPDGQLALIPFEALVDEDGRYLVERHPITYLSAGRDLLRMQVARASRSAPVIVADPLFGEPAPAASGARPDANAASSRPARRSITSGADLASMYFAPLAGTIQEARSIQSVFPDVQVLAGAQATESALKRVQAPRILHIATHGFFLQGEGTTDRTDAAAAGTRAIRATPSRIDNPLLRSGLALAGANLSAAAKDDGILTALEAAHLNLWGTKLVTLSACDTGIGVVRDGDGVYGLRRSIFLAGAETLVMSLWPVSDYVTRELMSAYYKGLKNGLGRGDALRQVQLSMLKRKNRSHPFYWASFIQAGEWANLEGRRQE